MDSIHFRSPGGESGGNPCNGIYREAPTKGVNLILRAFSLAWEKSLGTRLERGTFFWEICRLVILKGL